MKPWRIALGAVLAWPFAHRKVAARLSAARDVEDALRESQQRYERVMLASGAGLWDWDAVKDVFYVSPRFLEMGGLPPDTVFTSREDFLRRGPLHPEDREKWKQAVQQLFAGSGSRVSMEMRAIVNGETRWRRLEGICFRDASGKVVRWTGSTTDITDRKRAEEALRHSEERYSLAMEAAQDAHWDWNIGTDEYYTSVRAAEVLGLPPGTTFTSRQDYLARTTLMKEDLEKWQQAARELFAGTGSRLSMELRANVNGKIRWIQHNGVVLRDASGRAVRWCGSVRDVTERKRAEESLRLSEERYARAMEASEEGHFDWNVRTDEIFASARQREVLGLPEGAEYRTRSEMNAQVRYPPGERERLEATISRTLGSSDVQHESEYRVLRGEETRWLRRRWKILRDADGAALRVIGLVSDITERKLATEELRESEERFRALTELSSDWYWRQDENLRFSYISHQGLDATGVPGNAAIGMARWEFDHVKPLSGSWDEHKAQLAARLPFRDLELVSAAPDGTLSYLSISGAPVFDERGDFDGYQGIARNITERKRIEEELRSRQEELRRAQRLEGMGTLAGGIAHDFNNILGAILGYGEMAMRDAKEGTRLRRDLDSIMAAGERGRSLVDRILAFSRSGVAERVPVHVEAVVREALDQVAASLPENVTISPRLRAGKAAILGDSTQVHQVVMNLAANAVQAMPQGGILRVALETARYTAERPVTVGAIQPGDYLVLTVGDTGSGIPEGVLERMFDPFFTTKEVGVGSGLGLSLVHGIVTSVGGAIDVATQAGKGTTFTVYLHRSGDAAEQPSGERQPLTRGEGQRVLVVDDEEPLVRLATETLQSLGYAPIGFTSSTAALAAFRADPGRFDAVLTDERMPGLSGSALIREVRGIRDAIPVILMSGYLGMDSVDADVVVRKPLSARDLAACMARALRL